MGDLERLLASRARLVTLTGPGGVGKTRLAIQSGRSAAHRFGWHAYFVPLADLCAPSLLPAAIAATVGLANTTDADALERLVAALTDTPCLLVLDNFEHLLSPSPLASGGAERGVSDEVALVRLLLDRLPYLACLVTSRQPLRLQGEQLYAVPMLPLPEQNGEPAPLLTCPSVAL